MSYRISFFLLLFLLAACQADAPTEEELTPPTLPPPETDYVSEDYKWGFADARGNLVIEDVYDEVRGFDANNRALVRQSGRWHFIDRKGQMRGRDWRAAWPYAEGRARIQTDQDSIGFIDTRSRLVIPAIYNDAGDFQDGHAWVRQGDQYGLIDRSGKLVVPLQYERLSALEHGHLIFRQEEGYGLRSLAEEIIPAAYQRISYTGGELARVRQDGLYGYLQLQDGEWLIRPRYQMASDFEEDRACVLQSGEWALIDSSGQNYLREDYQQLFYGQEGRWIVESEGQYGAVDSSGQIVIPLVFSELQAFVEGFAPYSIEDQWGYLRPDGSQLTGPEYFLAWPFKDGLARVASQQGMVFIDSLARPQFEPRYIDLKDYSRGLAPVQVYRR
ncbi:MAG: WG repeat-containing protein [Bacteroidota bacterium]